MGGCRYPLLTSRDLGRPREEVRVSTCRVVERRAPAGAPSMSGVREKIEMPRRIRPPRSWARSKKTGGEESNRDVHATSENFTEQRGAEPVTKSDPLVEPTPLVAEALESPREAAVAPSDVDRTDPAGELTSSIAEVSEALEEVAAKLMRVEVEERVEPVEEEWELPDWFKQRQMASMARHAQRRGGMRFGMWGFPLEAWTPSSAC